MTGLDALLFLALTVSVSTNAFRLNGYRCRILSLERLQKSMGTLVISLGETVHAGHAPGPGEEAKP